MAPKAKSKAKTAMELAWEVETREQPMSRGKSDDLSDLATKVRKAINDNLRDTMTESEIYCTVVNGLTCFQQVMKDKEMWIRGLLGPMGSKYWLDIRTRYQGPDSMRQRILIAEGTVIEKPVLAAIEAALKHPPQRAPLLGLCRRMAVYKEGNALALMRMLTSVSASASSKQCELGMELIECLLRVGAFTRLPDMATVLRPKIDSVLLQAFLETYVNPSTSMCSLVRLEIRVEHEKNNEQCNLDEKRAERMKKLRASDAVKKCSTVCQSMSA
eukprot:6490291-Amphidinium_carterae.2